MSNYPLRNPQQNKASPPRDDGFQSRNFLRMGRNNLLLSWILDQFSVGGKLIITPSVIAEDISSCIGIHRTTLTRQLSSLAGTHDFPHFTITERGKKQQNRSWLVTFKGDVAPNHYWSPSQSNDNDPDNVPQTILERVVLGGLEWEAHCVSNNPLQKRMTGKQIAARTGYSLRAVRYAQARAIEKGYAQHTKVQETYIYTRHKYFYGIKTKAVWYKRTRTRTRRVLQVPFDRHEVQNCTPSPCASHRTKIVPPRGVQSQNLSAGIALAWIWG